ncbi:hypothetical protein DYI37_12110 [Fulvimarina endophytica]|uniref:Uncharacterized protein n=1 Tax=Fulvimarina endophytica TaxID=2293836 RepID=A0A371X3E6_9HYPH|nr:hypothetical protein [Fulvimarina endophytica]RFC63733.1 hypothetical protein DYI37_12110 [Fulvimarina endophytica]
MPRTRKPFTVETKKRRRSGSASETLMSLAEASNEPAKPEALKRPRRAAEPVKDTSEQSAMKEKVEAAARSGRILAERPEPGAAEPEPDLQPAVSEDEAEGPRQPARRYRRKQPVRSIDPADYEGREFGSPAPTPSASIPPAAEETAATASHATDDEQPSETATGIGYRTRRAWRTGGVALSERWKLRAHARHQMKGRRKTSR